MAMNGIPMPTSEPDLHLKHKNRIEKLKILKLNLSKDIDPILCETSELESMQMGKTDRVNIDNINLNTQSDTQTRQTGSRINLAKINAASAIRLLNHPVRVSMSLEQLQKSD